MTDIKGIEIEIGMRVQKLNKTKNNKPDLEGEVVENKWKDLGLAIHVDKAFDDGKEMQGEWDWMQDY